MRMFLLLLVVSACSREKSAAPAAQAPSAGPPPAAVAPAAPASACPLTAEQVGAAVSAAVKGPDSSCSFFPSDENKVRPRVTYVNQLGMACRGNMPADNGYSEKLEGLGTLAYVMAAEDVASVLVCREGAPFEIEVEMGNAQARAAATTLARGVLGGR